MSLNLKSTLLVEKETAGEGDGKDQFAFAVKQTVIGMTGNLNSTRRSKVLKTMANTGMIDGLTLSTNNLETYLKEDRV